MKIAGMDVGSTRVQAVLADNGRIACTTISAAMRDGKNDGQRTIAAHDNEIGFVQP